jgi:hypothetical protein
MTVMLLLTGQLLVKVSQLGFWQEHSCSKLLMLFVAW